MWTIPEKYLKRIPEGLIVEWAGRRKFFEVVEELTDSIWYIIMLFWTARMLIYFEIIDINSWQVQLALVLASVVFLLPAWLEIESWWAEYYVVLRHSDRDGGVIYKFDGILNPSPTPVNISPAMDLTPNEYKNNFFYWIWKMLTASRMMRVTIKTAPSHFLMNNRRIDPEYVAAIERVQHSPAPHRLSKDIPFWANVDGLIRLRNNGGIDEEFFQEISRKIAESLPSGGRNDLI